MPQITANIQTAKDVKEARRRALEAGVSLRNWAGAVIEKELHNHRAELKRGPKLAKP